MVCEDCEDEDPVESQKELFLKQFAAVRGHVKEIQANPALASSEIFYHYYRVIGTYLQSAFERMHPFKRGAVKLFTNMDFKDTPDCEGFYNWVSECPDQ